ncbi:MAG: hypothetical protein IID41_16540 [Planctomycetes bacterium]|nr:hypothetical protein [Planctomycetota bacterium]
MQYQKFSIENLLDFCCEFINQSHKAHGMVDAASQYFDCDRKTISRALNDLRRQKRLGRDVFRQWRDS